MFRDVDCAPGYTWGSPIVPTHARGYYRSLYQMCDAAGIARKYPACALEKATVFRVKHDCWEPEWLNSVAVYINNGSNPWHILGRQNCFGNLLSVAAPALATFWPGPSNTSTYGWLNALDPGGPGYPEAWWFTYGPPFSFYRLRDFSHWAYNDPALPKARIIGYAITMNGSDVFGNPWLNAI